MELVGLWEKIQEIFSFSLTGDVSDECLPWFLARRVTNWSATFGGIVLLGFIIYGGVLYMTSAGDPGKVEQGQKTIVNGVIGFVIAILAWTITSLIMWLFGVNNTCFDTAPTPPGMTEQECMLECTTRGESYRYVDSEGNCVCQ